MKKKIKNKKNDLKKWFNKFKTETPIILRRIKKKTWFTIRLITTQALIPGLIILLALGLLGVTITVLNYLGSVSLYFIIEEVKNLIKR